MLYISIVFQLGLQIPKGKENNHTRACHVNDPAALPVHIVPSSSHLMELRNSPHPMELPNEHAQVELEGGRYCINIEACSHKSFPVIEKEELRVASRDTVIFFGMTLREIFFGTSQQPDYTSVSYSASIE